MILFIKKRLFWGSAQYIPYSLTHSLTLLTHLYSAFERMRQYCLNCSKNADFRPSFDIFGLQDTIILQQIALTIIQMESSPKNSLGGGNRDSLCSIEERRESGGLLLGTYNSNEDYEVCLLTHSLTHLLTHSLTYSLTHLLTHSLTYLLTHSLTHLLTHRMILKRTLSSWLSVVTTIQMTWMC